ncbi:MAG: tetratricopeptide repeat protein [Planctomycetota bacterium]
MNRRGKINVKVLVILLVVVAAIGASLFAARHVRRKMLSRMDLNAGQAAYENEDWPAAHRHFQEYLGRNPDDLEVLKKYAEARMSIRPIDVSVISGAIAAYRRILQLDPLDEVAYDQLTELYAGIGHFEELAHVARTRIGHIENDRKAQLWLAEALIQLNKRDEARQILDEIITELEALPDEHYVQACLKRSRIAASESAPGVKTPLEYLNDALDKAPESVETLVVRARLYGEESNIPGVNEKEKERLRGVARKDLEAADELGTENPRLRAFLCVEWMKHGELDLAAEELRAVENLTPETVEEHYLDTNDLTVTKFLLASELATRRRASSEAASLADQALAALEGRHRVRVLPSAIRLYVTAGKVSEARGCLDEYLDTIYTQEGAGESRVQLAYLKALVANAEQRPYVVIDTLQPVVVTDASRPELWGLLAEAYSRTDQPRQAVSALIKYLRIRPNDPGVTLRLAKEYLKLRDWNRSFQKLRIVEAMNPADTSVRLLRIEASVNLVAGGETIDEEKLKTLSTELAGLRKEHPKRVDIRILQAMIALNRQLPDEAEKELKLAIEQCDEPLRAEMQLVKHYYRTDRMAEAVKVCLDACKRHSEVAEPWLSLAGLHVAKADYDSARRCLKDGLGLVEDGPERRALSMRLALLEVLYADRDTGIRLLSETAEQDKQEIHARSVLLGIREIREDQAKAQKLVDELREAETDSGLMWRLHQASLWLSSDQWRSKQLDIADLLQHCISSDPKWSSPVLLLVDMYEKLDDPKRIEDTCRQALAKNPSAADIADRLVTLLEKQRRFSEAETILQQVDANPRVASAWNVRLALQEEDFNRAMEELKVRVSNDDRDANSRILLARLAYREEKDVARAFALLDEAEEITPDSMALTAARVSILKAEGRSDEAQRVLNDYVKDYDTFGAYMIRAEYLAGEGEFEGAERDYRKTTTFAEQGAIGYELLSDFYARNKKLDKAVATLEEGLNAHPGDLRLTRRLMKTLFMPGPAQDRQRAGKILDSLEERLQEDPELMKLRALQLLEESTPQSLADARRRLEDAVKAEPTAVDAHLLLIGVAIKAREYEDARNYAIQALGSNPDDLDLLSARAGTELELGNTRMAAELVHLVLERDPDNVRAREVLVAIALRSKDNSLLNEAQTLIESATVRTPMDEKLLISRARFLIAVDLAENAIPELEAYCQTSEGGRSVYSIVTLADLHRLCGNLDESEKRIEQAEGIDPNSQLVIHGRFAWLVAKKRFEELAGISSVYLSAKDQNPTLLMLAALELARLDSIALKKEGAKLFEHLVALDPTSKDARLGLASTSYQTGNVERAESIYQELLKQFPNDKRILNDLAWILQAEHKQYDAALELANKGLSLAPDDLQGVDPNTRDFLEILHLLDTRGTILSKLPDRRPDAKSDFERVVELSQPNTRRKAKAFLQLGRICVNLKDLEQAKEHVNNALEIDRKIDVFTPEERSDIAEIIRM